MCFSSVGFLLIQVCTTASSVKSSLVSFVFTPCTTTHNDPWKGKEFPWVPLAFFESWSEFLLCVSLLVQAFNVWPTLHKLTFFHPEFLLSGCILSFVEATYKLSQVAKAQLDPKDIMKSGTEFQWRALSFSAFSNAFAYSYSRIMSPGAWKLLRSVTHMLLISRLRPLTVLVSLSTLSSDFAAFGEFSGVKITRGQWKKTREKVKMIRSRWFWWFLK